MNRAADRLAPYVAEAEILLRRELASLARAGKLDDADHCAAALVAELADVLRAVWWDGHDACRDGAGHPTAVPTRPPPARDGVPGDGA